MVYVSMCGAGYEIVDLDNGAKGIIDISTKQILGRFSVEELGELRDIIEGGVLLDNGDVLIDW